MDRGTIDRAEPGANGLIGERIRRHDGDLFVSGGAIFTADVDVPDALHVAVVRSPHAHAQIDGFDVDAAAAHPGVVAVLSGRDLDWAGDIPYSTDPAALGGRHTPIHPLAIDKVVYVGEPVVAVVARDIYTAAEAARLVRVAYTVLPAVLDVDSALAADAPLIHPEWGDNVIIAGHAGADDFDTIAATAPRLLEGRLVTQRTGASPMEPRAYVASWDGETDRLTVWATTQNPHVLRSMLATSLKLQEHDIRVIVPRLGGSFGLKMYGQREDFLAATIAVTLKRSIRFVEDRSATLLAGSRDQTADYRAAFTDEGRILGIDVSVRCDHGAANPGGAWAMGYVGALSMGLGYDIDHCHVHYVVAVTNKGPWNGTKPFGKDGATLVIERIIERIAAETGVDPIEVRRLNYLPPEAFPHTHTTGLEVDSGDYGRALTMTLDALDLEKARNDKIAARAEGRHLGIGIALEVMPESADIPGTLVSAYDTSTVRMTPSGEAVVLTGVTSPGNGNDTTISQLVAGELGIPLTSVRIVQGDTDLAPYGFGNLSSRSIITGGNAAVLAARDVAAKLRLAARRLAHAADDVEVVLADGFATVHVGPEEKVPLPMGVVANAVYSLAYLLQLGIEPNLESTRTYSPANIRHAPDERGNFQTYTSYPYAVHATIVELDPDTGLVTLLRHVVTHDCGTVINPLMVDGQIRGGVAMGWGAAFGEDLAYSADGQPLAAGFKTYLLPRAADMPRIEVLHLATPSPGTPLGAKGVGEAGFSGALAAAMNAVNDALAPFGASIESTPLSPPAVISALAAADAPIAGRIS